MTPENSKNDYSFIMDQPGPELKKPKRSKKPLVVIGVAMVLLTGLMVTSLIISKRATNVKPGFNASQQSAQFLTYVANGEDENAFNMYAPSKQIEKDFFINSFAKPFANLYDIKSCKEVPADASQGNTINVVYRCPRKSDPANKYVDLAFVYTQNTTSGNYELTSVTMKAIKA